MPNIRGSYYPHNKSPVMHTYCSHHEGFPPSLPESFFCLHYRELSGGAGTHTDRREHPQLPGGQIQIDLGFGNYGWEILLGYPRLKRSQGLTQHTRLHLQPKYYVWVYLSFTSQKVLWTQVFKKKRRSQCQFHAIRFYPSDFQFYMKKGL